MGHVSISYVVLGLVAGFLLTGSPIRAQVDYYAPENVQGFAQYLLAEGNYLRAAGEFERYYVMIGDHVDRDSTVYKIARCYTLANRPDDALRYYEVIIRQYADGVFLPQAVLGIGWSHFQRGEYWASINAISDYPMGQSTTIARKNLISLNYLHLRRWSAARDILLADGDSANTANMPLAVIARRGLELPRKSPVLAGSFSAIFPGAGRIYSGHLMDGLYSLLVVGTTGWQAYEGFHDDGPRSKRGWIYGTVCSLFYLGNVYGSVVAAKIHNNRLEISLLRDADDLVEKLIP